MELSRWKRPHNWEAIRAWMSWPILEMLGQFTSQVRLVLRVQPLRGGKMDVLRASIFSVDASARCITGRNVKGLSLILLMCLNQSDDRMKIPMIFSPELVYVKRFLRATKLLRGASK